MSRRLLGAVLLVVAGVAAAVGTFLPLSWEGSDYRGASPRVVTTSWRVFFENMPAITDFDAPRSPQYGVPIVVSAVLLGVAAALVFLPEAQRLVARYLAVAGTGLLAGSVWATGSAVAAVMANRPPEGAGDYALEVGEGIVVLGASVLVAVVGVVLMHAERAAPRPEGPVVYRVDDDVAGGDDTDTPPFGIPVPEVEVVRLPVSGYERRAEEPGSGA
ncbi:MAG: hypothetical protein HOV94_37750 [Saccharothrix sp.]|nr:hypothetical protein [Saccharothrix sp.]